MSFKAAHLSFASGGATVGLLAALHFLSPEFDPAWQMVSEYARGEYGWVLSLMFLTWASSCITLIVALKPYVRAVSGKIGLGLLLVSAVGTGMAAFFDISHSLHGLAFMIGIPSLSIAALLVSRSVLRDPTWTSQRRFLLAAAHLPWMSVALMAVVVIIGLSQSGGQFGPDVLVGWPNRLVVLAYCGWLMAAARGAIQVERQ